MDAKVVRITMIPKGFTQSKKGVYPVYKAGYWLMYFTPPALYEQN